MHLFHIPECTIQNRNGAFLDVEQVYHGVCELGQFLEEWHWSNQWFFFFFFFFGGGGGGGGMRVGDELTSAIALGK